ncbi:MAG: DUF983 domain-containing protein [Chitinophagaceae bacterium]|nr:DUF983 domain-containing protein [Chitinophagaceae bacterium]
MDESKKPVPNFLWSILSMKCPRCRRGPMFTEKNSYKSLKLSKIFEMPDNCSVCGQKFDLEPGFWYGTGYVSYALAVAVSVTTFIAWMVLIGISTEDNRVFFWLGLNALLLVVLQPWLMRLSRVLYIRIFVRYHKEFEQSKPVEFD